jgi:hypothetical protein
MMGSDSSNWRLFRLKFWKNMATFSAELIVNN